MAEKLQKLKCINALDLKILAMALMLGDHLWATIVPGRMWLTALGRLAFPIFAFQIAEGFARTRNFKRYLGRMFLFALISEAPFNMMYGGGVIYPFHQNVLFTFCIALLTLRGMAWGLERRGVRGWAATAASCALGWLVGTATLVDYGGLGVLTVVLFWCTRGKKFGWLVRLAGLWLINGVWMGGMLIPVELGPLCVDFPQQGLAVLSLIPIGLYNGRRGPGGRAVQYACYAFYPLHILILALLWRYAV